MRKAIPTSAALFVSLFAAGQATNYPNGSTVDDFTVTDTQGGVHHLYNYTAAGKYVILDFFFYNCGPCQANAPYYSQLYETYGCNGHDLICVEINSGTDTDALAEQFAEDFGGPWAHPPAVGSGGGQQLTSNFGVGAFPTFCLIGPDNTMINQDIWPITDGMDTFVAAFPPGSGIDVAACEVGIHERPVSTITGIFPSPTSGVITLTIDPGISAATDLDVLDISGRTVHSMRLEDVSGSAQRTLDLGALSDGNYLLRLRNGMMVTGSKPFAIAH